MSLAIGTRLAAYEVIGSLGAGGMGEVYRARDTKLNRDVALKILPEIFAADPDHFARFVREAQTLAALNHPYIGQIYGVEDSNGVRALVMEFVDGEDLTQRIDRGPIPLDEALPLARQIAEALEAAHEQGIVHRDLKPANIRIRVDATVKVLDFGLAKLGESALASPPGASMSPTITTPAMTEAGMILGTAAYMSPEQARGKIVDKRTDIWAFGVVVYEMLTGRRMFAGAETTDLLAAVLRQDVDWSALPAGTPPRLRQLLERCLDRDPKTRLRDMGEARVVLAEPGARLPPTRNARGLSVAAAAAIALLVAVLTAVLVMRMRPSASAIDSSPLVRLSLDTPDVVVSEVGSATISPDGTKVVFAGRGTDGRKVLWVRSLDSLDAVSLPDTDDAIEPFWSWDSKSIAFGAQGKLKRLDLGAARAKVLADATRSNNGSWSRDGVIVFSPDYDSPLFKVAATGGQQEEIPGTKDGRYPQFLPDAKHFLYSRQASGRILLRSLDSQEEKEVLSAAAALYAPPGWLLYFRDGIIVAQTFDATRGELSGDPIPIAPAQSDISWAQGSRLSVSETGVLVIAHAAAYDYQLAWFDRDGAPAGPLGPVRRVTFGLVPRISPNGSRVVVQINDVKTQNRDLWVGDVLRGTLERLTTTPVTEQLPVWSSDGRYVFTTSNRKPAGVYRIPVGGGIDEHITGGFVVDATRDGRWLLVMQRGDTTRVDIATLHLTDGLPTAGATAQVLLDSEFDEMNAAVSPDGRWLAYTSDVSGSFEVYVRRLTDGRVGAATRVTTGGAVQPCWSRDGRTLFYVSTADGMLSARMMSVKVTPAGDVLNFGSAMPLFQTRMFPAISTVRDYDVAPDGRFLVGTVVGRAKGIAATTILNWPKATTTR